MTDNKLQKEYLMYMHAGSGNHGCEAIVRSLCDILSGDHTLLSNRINEDNAAGLDRVCKIIPVRRYEDSFVLKSLFFVTRRLTHNAAAQMAYAYKNAGPFFRYDMALSVGGDNYCYDDALVNLGGANAMFAQKGIPTALVGCSVEPDIMKRPSVKADLSSYKCIIARESVSYAALKETLPSSMSDDIYLLPDPAFALKPVPCKLPEGFVTGHTIGINISPMILGYETRGAEGITLKNYTRLIRTILDETDDKVVLIPHVTTGLSDDRKPIGVLYDMFKDTGRVIKTDDMSACELKYIISCCRLLIAARTHASIAAYSTCVPTMVVGYSVKAAGIADDIFGTREGYVCPVQSLRDENDLTDAYRWLEEHADEQKQILNSRMPDWIEKTGEMSAILSKYNN
ncbi:MAG: polysaccharide pyruvyl transferase family protein [Lachnospiraceae bacterium]|nr:polysaccharide pyruvyl transferase family protein [Lachnospiraceae bacterium]